MFSSSGYFRGINCPFYVSGLCERPYCHFRHSRVEGKPQSKQENGPSYSSTRSFPSGTPQPLTSSSIQTNNFGQKDITSHSTVASNEPAGRVEEYDTSLNTGGQGTKISTCPIPSFSETPQQLPEPDEVPVQFESLPKISGLPKPRNKRPGSSDTPSYIPTPKRVHLILKGTAPSYSPTPKQSEGSYKKSRTVEYDPVKNFAVRDKTSSNSEDEDDDNHSGNVPAIESKKSDDNLSLQDETVEACFSDDSNKESGGNNKKTPIDEDDLTDSDEDVSHSTALTNNPEEKIHNYAELLTPSSYFTSKLNSPVDRRPSAESTTNPSVKSHENNKHKSSTSSNASHKHNNSKHKHSHRDVHSEHSNSVPKSSSIKDGKNVLDPSAITSEKKSSSGSSASHGKYHRSSSTPLLNSQVKHSHKDNKSSLKVSSEISSSNALAKQSHKDKDGKNSLKNSSEKSLPNNGVKHSHKRKDDENSLKDSKEKSSSNSHVKHSTKDKYEKNSIKDSKEKSSSNSHVKLSHTVKDDHSLKDNKEKSSLNSHVKLSHKVKDDDNSLKDKSSSNCHAKQSHKDKIKDISEISSSRLSSKNIEQVGSSEFRKGNKHKSPSSSSSSSSKAEPHSHKTGSSRLPHKFKLLSHDLPNGHVNHQKENRSETNEKPPNHKHSDSKMNLPVPGSEIKVKSEHSTNVTSEKHIRRSSEPGHQADSHRRKSLNKPNDVHIKQERRDSVDKIKSSEKDTRRRNSRDNCKQVGMVGNERRPSDKKGVERRGSGESCKSVTERRISHLKTNLFGEESDGCSSDSDVQIVEPPVQQPPPVYELSESDNDHDNDSEEEDSNLTFSDEIDFLSESDTFDECLRIFDETERRLAAKSVKTEGVTPDTAKKLEVPKVTEDSENLLMSLSKKRMAHKSTSQVRRPVKTPATLKPRLSPAEVMHNRIVEMQKRALLRAAKREGRESELPMVLSDTSLSTVNKLSARSNLAGNVVSPLSSSSLSEAASSLLSSHKKREAHVPILKTPTKLAQLSTSPATRSPNSFYNKTKTAGPSTSTDSVTDEKYVTIASTASKTEKRKAHEPTQTNLVRPIIPAEFGTKVPSNIRQRYLNLIIDEYLKFNPEETAFSKAQEEEQVAYNRASNKNIYLRLAVNTIKRIRTEALESQPSSSKKPCPGLTSSSMAAQSHEAQLGGSLAAKISYTLHRSGNSVRSVPQTFSGKELYDHLTKYLLTEQQLRDNGYPRSAEDGSNKAKFYKENETDKMLKDNERTCRRCGKRFYINKDGDPVTVEQCVYHYANAYKKKFAGFIDSRYGCCNERIGSKGCQVAKCHVHEKNKTDCLTGYMKTLPASSPLSAQNYGVFSLDCEMVYTKNGLELARVTVIGDDNSVKYETLVKPDAKIIDYNTRFSGITEKDMTGVTTNLRGVQAVMLSMISDQTILIGHSLESDLQSLKLIHGTVVDTSLVFPHRLGLPYKRALRSLMVDHLQKIIQSDDGGHDSKEDAVACMQLMLYKVKADVRRR